MYLRGRSVELAAVLRGQGRKLVHVSFTPDLVAVDVVHLVDLGLTRVDVGEALTRVACGRFQPGWLNLSSFYHFFSVSMKNNLFDALFGLCLFDILRRMETETNNSG